MGLVVTPQSVERSVGRSVGHGEPGQDGRRRPQGGALGGGEVAQLLGEPGVATLPVGQHGGTPRLGGRDDHLTTVGVVAHVLPARGTSDKDDSILGHRDFTSVTTRIEETYRASLDYLDQNVADR